ncbi:GNAT family N-acetyltransferase [Streptomyces hainanensis]|uniref:N-acetyltransferase n=1 Tax=Streptomyces hainanensis TaxID=402648 RepID=A0A4R4TDH4_9ACTN|nr:GNAT family N-acetyltransferase [Streptomyces hainanensis]TDC75598.1 N-acetyltransferase [Streptomyces hainanensis]
MDVEISTLAERPELLVSVWELDPGWPAFMYHGPVADAHYGHFLDTFLDFSLVATSGSRVVARGYTVPFTLDFPGRKELPPDGWDRMLIWAFTDHRCGRKPDTVGAVEIVVAPDQRDKGLSSTMLAAMKDNARRHGFTRMVAPVRPTAKHEEPETPMGEYTERTRADGLPSDPWLRAHVRIGGRITGVAPASTVISGSLGQWREWTGLPFETEGPVVVPGALAPVWCSPRQDSAVYVEPNVWVEYSLSH